MPNNDRRKFRLPKRFLAIGLAAGFAAGGTAATMAANDIVAEWDHFVSCLDFIINDEPSHQRNCTPNRSVPPFESLSTTNIVGAPTAVPSPDTGTGTDD